MANNVFAGADGLTVLPFRIKAMQEKLKGLGFSPDAIQPYFVKAFLPLVAGQTHYPIAFSKKDNVDNSADKTQCFIPNNDAFAPVGIGIGVKKVTVANADYGSRIYRYAEKGVFDAASGAEQAAVSGVFTGGWLNIAADNQEIIMRVNHSDLEFVPRTQVSATTHPASGNRAEMESYTLLTKEFLLFGQNDNVANIYLVQTPTTSIAGDTGEQNYVGILLAGLIIRNGGAGVLNLDVVSDGKYALI